MENQYELARTFLNGIATIQFHDDDIPPNRSAEMTDYYVRGRIDPRTRVRRLEQIDLWEISIVTFPLLAGARVRAVEKGQGASLARRAATKSGRAERAWRTIANADAARRSPNARQASV